MGFVIAAAVVGGLLLVWTATMPFLRYRVHRWEASGTAVYAKTGWLSREWKVAPLSRIQSVEAKRNPLHQLLGLAQVSVTTASAHGSIIIEGLDKTIADDLVAELTVATESTVGDAT
jgi:membrane protein YdbS with pleckstrin-like domain